MSSHSSLPHIPEILTLICEYLSPEKKNLASLARTCKMFEEPALDVLWFELDRFYPLAKCLPFNVWTEEEHDGNKEYLVLKRPLLSTDCLRFTQYAKRIQRFSSEFESTFDQLVHKTVYEGLQVAMRGGKIFPNVQHLTWNSRDDTFPFIHMFLGPRITKIKYMFSAKSSAQISMVPALCEQYPFLECVEFSIHLDGASVKSERRAIELISNSVYKWKNLKMLNIPNLTYSALLKISQLPHLETLRIMECKLGAVPTRTVKSGFPMLSSLVIQGCQTVLDCILVLTLMDYSPLSDLQVVLAGVETSSTWERVFLAINQHCCHDTLIDLTCWDGDQRNKAIILGSDRAEMVKYEDVRPLLVFYNLKELDIGFTRGFYLSDPDAINEMAICWEKFDV
ncbi:hypothetical protein BDQ17DRAFT_1430990 [Cyathus striatus]|nr:hypothetical protein BDQ17DRAFT_1430990 [Cyathus striatus]